MYASAASSLASDKPRLFLIDGSGFIFRAYHSLPPLTRADGTPVGAVYGFVNMILKLLQGMRATPGIDSMAVIFDAERQTFRNRLYAEYKANRPPPPEDLIPQFPLMREATVALGLPSIELIDYEADDLIATYTKLARAQGMEVVIVSSDKDLMQLVGEGVKMYDAMKNKIIGDAEVMEKFGVPAARVLDVLSLMGDSSDNIPGVAGIGPKTAAELIIQFGDLDTLLARAGEIKQAKRRETLLASVDKAKLSRELITLCETVSVPQPLENLLLQVPDRKQLAAFALAQNFKSLVQKISERADVQSLSGSSGEAAQALQTHSFGNVVNSPLKKADATIYADRAGSKSADAIARYELVRDGETLRAWIEKATAAGIVAFDTETTGLDAMQAQLVGFSLAINPYEACYVPLAHVRWEEISTASQGSLFDGPVKSEGEKKKVLVERQIDLETAMTLLAPLLENTGVLKIGHNIKYDMLVLRKHGITVQGFDDTMLLSYLLGAGLYAHNLDEVAERVLGHKNISYNEVTGTGKARITFAEVELEKACAYAAEDADVTLRLWQALKPRVITERLVTVYETLERSLVPVLMGMEEAGIAVDPLRLAELSKDFEHRLALLEKEIHVLANQEFLISSPKQLGEVLFDAMGLAGGKKSKTGAYATGAGVLEELAEQGHAIATKVLEWRQLAKLKNTYTDALQNQINPDTQRVHTSYAMAIASTGRLSSTDPNLQNIPVRTVEGRKIRSAFVAPAGKALISADYSQIELRLLAHMADIPVLKDAFKNGADIHAITASQMFGISVNDVSSELRRQAKTINFGIIYGISAHGLAVRLGISRGDAAQYIERYFTQYPGIKAYMESKKAEARAHGFVTTLYGRRCHVPGINDRNPNMRAFSERAAINAPLQGTAADIIKLAMITLDRAIREENLPARMLLQVHDELVLEVEKGSEEKIAARVKYIMESAAHLSVPLTVETGTGAHWDEVD